MISKDKILEKLTDEKLREHIQKEFVQSGFIDVLQSINFIDYLRMLIMRNVEESVQETAKEIFAEIENFKVEKFDGKESIIFYRILDFELKELKSKYGVEK